MNFPISETAPAHEIERLPNVCVTYAAHYLRSCLLNCLPLRDWGPALLEVTELFELLLG